MPDHSEPDDAESREIAEAEEAERRKQRRADDEAVEHGDFA